MTTPRESQPVELVDSDGAAIGSTTVDEAHRAPGQLHRAFSVFLRDPSGQVLLQQRAAAKTRFPLRWANTCCGHPRPGEEVAVAAARRLVEEIGIGGVALTEVGVYSYYAEDPATGRVEYEYDHVLLGELPAAREVLADAEEVAAVRWLPLPTLSAELASDPRVYAPWVAGVTQRLRTISTLSGSRVPDDALTAGAVARQLGVAVTTLRTWHQRYGLGPSHHVAGQHRRYTPEDMERLQVMRRLTAQGVSPAEAAAWARRAPALGSPDSPDLLDHARDGGGRAIAVGRAGPAARGLARAAMRLDAPALRDILDLTIADHGVIGAWEDVIMPVLIGIGERYEATKKFIEVEHLISRSVTEALSTVTRPHTREPIQVLLAAADEEQHTLPLEALAAALAEAGVPTRLLGPRVPPEALAETIARTGPSAVVVWSQRPGTASSAQLAEILTARHRPVLVAAAGPGWTKDELPPGATLLGSLPEAVATLSAATGPR